MNLFESFYTFTRYRNKCGLRKSIVRKRDAIYNDVEQLAKEVEIVIFIVAR